MKVPAVPLTLPVKVPAVPLTLPVKVPLVALILPLVVIPPLTLRLVKPDTPPLESITTEPIVPLLELILSDFNSLVRTVCDTKRLPTKRLF